MLRLSGELSYRGIVVIAAVQFLAKGECGGKNCYVKFKDGKLIQKGDCENPDSHPIINELRKAVPPETCENVFNELAKIRNDTGGVFDINHPRIGKIEVYCDTKTDGGGWTVFQRRMDGGVDFFLGWNDYVNGFGNKEGEFWLGLEAIHQMTKDGKYELRIDMIKTGGTHQYAKYSSFAIGPASDYYRLSVIGYSGNATEQLFKRHRNMRFSTKDRDHDTWESNCALRYTGAWWYATCYYSNLNGIFGRNDDKGIVWNGFNRFTEMKFRRKD